MWPLCGGGCNCRQTGFRGFVEDHEEEDPKEEQATYIKLRVGDPVIAAVPKVVMAGCPVEPLKAAIVEEEKPSPVPVGQRMPFAPLEEDKPIFQMDADRLMVAKSHLLAFRQNVEKELLSNLQDGPLCKDGPLLEAERHFCSDATLLRYLCANEGNESKAMGMLRDTLRWRRKYFFTSPGEVLGTPVCPKCTSDPNSHCFLNLGKDAAGRTLIYSCSGRGASKGVQDGMRHMASQLERIFDGNSGPGQITLIVDFAGFGLVDCNPRMAAAAVPLFACHYPERIGQIVLFTLPIIFRAIYSATMKLVDPVIARKVVILHTPEARRRYSKCYWSCNPPMAAWIEAVITCKGVPGSYPDIGLSQALGQTETCDLLERCALGAGTSNH